ncbi:hypothetical protein GCM10023190_25780 [Enteractinococcus fodinae]|uniref:Threonine dehydrogenase-like Zn-dependent dehydrogenase n=1 Tax=Enteractinococcus fodinae TaxID=684663 RepID=A0ABU2B230_9MICC|nr:hypothetical protein [Enteractinococcus fodinae]MDR7347657.1 threonine dehydrogenase-like Zn-dependent dehydrogenase [Enteractinococcus fodinae]
MTEQDPQQASRRGVSNGMLWLVAALLATYAGVVLPLPYKVIAPVFALAAVVAAIRVFRLASKGQHSMLVWFVGTVGLLGALFYGGVATSQIILWEPTQRYEQCMAQALTDTRQAQCESQYSASLWD